MANSGIVYGTPVIDTLTVGSTGPWDDESQADGVLFKGTPFDLSGKAGVEVKLIIDSADPGPYEISFLKDLNQSQGYKTLTIDHPGGGVETWVWNFSAQDFQHMFIWGTNNIGTTVATTVLFTPNDISPAS